MSLSKNRISAVLPHLALALLRIVIGWHFLYEGWTKLAQPGWTSSGYLKFSTGPFASLFQWLGASEPAVRVIDQLNIWGLLLVGLALMLGVLTRPAAVSGMALLALYYFAYPPFFSPVGGSASEGQYLIVNKNLVELFALAVIFAAPGAKFSLGALLARRSTPQNAGAPQGANPPVSLSRRELAAAFTGVPFLGGLALSILRKHGWKSFEEMQLRARTQPGDVTVASATLKRFQFTTIRDLRGQLPQASIKNVRLSRMILGGNLIGGWAHARDLVYVSELVKAYHTRNKIFETFDLAESCGINTFLTNPALCGVVNDYWRCGGKIQFISDCGGSNVLEMIRKSIDSGACGCYIQGGIADKLVAEGKFDLIAKALDLIRKNGLPAGIGGHKLATVKGCVNMGLRPDFWMKTLHHVNYWSARPDEPGDHDNNWCDSPEETIALMRALPEPWIAFKVLAAGAINPKEGFRYAFENGADFICVGMYDFQVVDDANIALDVLNSRLARAREWRA